MLYRIELRNLCRDVLASANTLAGPRVFQVLAWPTTLKNTPAIYVAAPQDSASSTGRGAGDYTRTTTVQTLAVLAGLNMDALQQQADTLAEQIELAIVTSQRILAATTQISSFHSLTELSADQATYTASITTVFDLEYVEAYPRTGDPLLSASGALKTL